MRAMIDSKTHLCKLRTDAACAVRPAVVALVGGLPWEGPREGQLQNDRHVSVLIDSGHGHFVHKLQIVRASYPSQPVRALEAIRLRTRSGSNIWKDTVSENKEPTILPRTEIASDPPAESAGECSKSSNTLISAF
jgi:hypothetical protein